jgi:hypothetical protein
MNNILQKKWHEKTFFLIFAVLLCCRHINAQKIKIDKSTSGLSNETEKKKFRIVGIRWYLWAIPYLKAGTKMTVFYL